MTRLAYALARSLHLIKIGVFSKELPMKNTNLLFTALTLIAGVTLTPVAVARSCDYGHEHSGD